VTTPEPGTRRGATPDTTIPATNATRSSVTFVTGAAGGIGHATALAFARRDDAVAVSDHDKAGVEAVADSIAAAGGQALAVQCDVTSIDSIQTALRATIDRFGRLDYAFNNAGVDRRGRHAGAGMERPRVAACLPGVRPIPSSPQRGHPR
jgi:NAD(P)-dependent dehydrogenase (short-subunit alcohol dehydrogenase family)